MQLRFRYCDVIDLSSDGLGFTQVVWPFVALFSCYVSSVREGQEITDVLLSYYPV